MVKRAADFEGNPDVWINPKSGEVFLETIGGGVGDSIGNIFEFLQ